MNRGISRGAHSAFIWLTEHLDFSATPLVRTFETEGQRIDLGDLIAPTTQKVLVTTNVTKFDP
jgi:hypothetical protein